METKINRFKIKGSGWIQVNNHLISFGHHQLPNDQHLTISFNSRYGVELHVTRNIPNHADKPKYPIIAINRNELEQDLEKIFLTIWFNIFEEIDIDKLVQNDDYYYLSHKELEETNSSRLLEKEIKQQFEKIAKIGDSRLVISGNWQNGLENLICSEKLSNTINESLVRLGDEENKDFDCGVLWNGIQAFHVSKIHNNWFMLKQDMELKDVLKNIVESTMISRIWERISHGIDFLKTANTKKDTEHLKPIILTKSHVSSR